MAHSSPRKNDTNKWLVTFLSICLAVLVGYYAGSWRSDWQQKEWQLTQERLEKTYAEVEKLTRRINMLEVEIEVEKLANKDIQASLTQARTTIAEQKRELTFFEKIMAPEREANGVVFDSFTLTELTSERRFRFKLVLTQLQRTKRFAKGQVVITLKGTQNKQVLELDLAELANLDKAKTSFSFQYFTIIEGDFYLPENFIPDGVDVKAIFPKTKWQAYAELNDQFPWVVNT